MDELLFAASLFDDSRDLIELTRYADVVAALRDPRLVANDGPPEEARPIRAAHRLPGDRISSSATESWRLLAEASTARLARELPLDCPIDLLDVLAAPCSESFALEVCGARSADAPGLCALARSVFLAAANATGSDEDPHARESIASLAAAFARSSIPGPLAVQSFVALSQTLPHLLAAAWLALIQHPDQMQDLRANPDLMPRAVEELLRHSGPSRAVFRYAHAPVTIGNAQIAKGDRVALLIAAANRDPARFPNPDRLDLRRDTRGHLAFGRGTHSCVGASLIRTAVAVATSALLDATTDIELAGEVEWIDGYAIRAPATLPVIVRRTTD